MKLWNFIKSYWFIFVAIVSGWLAIGVAVVVLFNFHPESMMRDEVNPRLKGLLTVMWPVVIVVDGLNLGLYELGLLTASENEECKS
jgi:hypothetical protein